jgi:hypothetical protein
MNETQTRYDVHYTARNASAYYEGVETVFAEDGEDAVRVAKRRLSQHATGLAVTATKVEPS